MENSVFYMLLLLLVSLVGCLLFRSRLPLLLIAGPLFISFSWRLVSVLYIGVNGPVFAEELDRHIGPSGAWLLVLAILLTLAPMAYIWRRQAVQQKFRSLPILFESNHGIALRDIVYYVILTLIVLLYVELFSAGVIPFFASMERTPFNLEQGRYLHHFFLEHGPMIAFNLGVITCYPWLRLNKTDNRPVFLIVSLFIYFLLTGHRFSIFLSLLTFFLSPSAVLLSATQMKQCSISPTKRHPRILKRNSPCNSYGFVIVFAMATMTLGLVNSYFFARAPRDTIDDVDHRSLRTFVTGQLVQRVGVQQSAMWFPTYERIFHQNQWEAGRAIHWIFKNPINPHINPGIQYLMMRELGTSKTHELLGRGHQYASNHVAVFFELMGPVVAWPAFIALGGIMGWLLRTLATSIWEGRYFTLFFGGYLYYAMMLIAINGMVNSLIAYTFWTKFILFTLSYFIEKHPYFKRGILSCRFHFNPWTRGVR